MHTALVRYPTRIRLKRVDFPIHDWVYRLPAFNCRCGFRSSRRLREAFGRV